MEYTKPGPGSWRKLRLAWSEWRVQARAQRDFERKVAERQKAIDAGNPPPYNLASGIPVPLGLQRSWSEFVAF
jgi:hypothetical protein